jgi:hypothetical protein
MEGRLRELSDWLDVADPVDQRAAVRARLEQPGPVDAVRRRVRRWVAAVAAAAVCAVLVTPPARAAVVDAVGGLLRIAGVQVTRGTPGALPTDPDPLPSSSSVSLENARRLATFTVRAPTGLGPPDVTVADPAPDGAPRVVTLTYRGGTIRLDQLNGQLEMGFMKTAADAQWATAGGQTAVWLPGPHAVTYVDRSGTQRTEGSRLAGPSLIWTWQSVTYRLEGVATLAEATAIADSLQ